VSIGHDSFAFDDKAGSASALDRFESPRRVPDRLLHEGGDLYDGTFRVRGTAERIPSANQGNE